MSNRYIVVSDSACDLPAEEAARLGIRILPIYVKTGEDNFRKEGEELSVQELYEQMLSAPKRYPSTSTPSPEEYYNFFGSFAEQGLSVLYLCLTSTFSSMYQTACKVAAEVERTHPQVQIRVIDSRAVTVTLGTLVRAAAEMAADGVPLEEAAERLEKMKETSRIFFTVGSLDYLQHGGRIGKVSSIAGSLLGIKPMILMKDGVLNSAGVARGRAKSIDQCGALLTDYLKKAGKPLDAYLFTAGYGHDRQEGEAIVEKIQTLLEKEFGSRPEIPLYRIGATVGTHIGPYGLGIALVEKG